MNSSRRHALVSVTSIDRPISAFALVQRPLRLRRVILDPLRQLDVRRDELRQQVAMRFHELDAADEMRRDVADRRSPATAKTPPE